MRNALRIAAGFFVLSTALHGVSIGAEKKKAAAAAGPQSYKVDTSASSLRWNASKVTGKHDGTVNVKSGDVAISAGALVGGTIEIDMTSLAVSDLQGDSNAKLTGHLKSDDFFSTEKFPTATFKSTSVEAIAGAKPGEANYKVTGDLTIKGVSNPSTFNVAFAEKAGIASLACKEIKVDRTLYGIRYGSGKFFQGLGDKIIHDEFVIAFDLTAKK